MQSAHAINMLTEKVIGCAIEVHKTLGCGLLENIYTECLNFELNKAGLTVEKEKPLPIIYKDQKFDMAYRIDLLVNQQLIIEVKAVETLLPIHQAQLLTYMRLLKAPLGLLLNFNSLRLTDGIKRMTLQPLTQGQISE